MLFDMDGVIVDSMPYHFLAWYEALRPLGIRVSCFDVYAREGERWEKSLDDFLRQGGIRSTPGLLKRVFESRQKIFKKYFRRRIFQGAQEFLRCLKQQGYLLGLVTGTPQDQLKGILPAGIRRLFDALVTGDQVRHGKPHPEPFLKAARELGLKTEECLVIENAPLGIRSAHAAGMFCVAITTSLPREYLKAADAVVERLEQVTGMIERACRVQPPHTAKQCKAQNRTGLHYL